MHLTIIKNESRMVTAILNIKEENIILFIVKNVIVIHLMSITRGVLAQSPEPEARDNVFWQ